MLVIVILILFIPNLFWIYMYRNLAQFNAFFGGLCRIINSTIYGDSIFQNWRWSLSLWIQTSKKKYLKNRSPVLAVDLRPVWSSKCRSIFSQDRWNKKIINIQVLNRWSPWFPTRWFTNQHWRLPISRLILLEPLPNSSSTWAPRRLLSKRIFTPISSI